jgi:pyridoxal phosphate enzyme (YggS family)
MSTVAANLAAVRRRIENACARSGRALESVELIAVSKLHKATLIRDCHAAGQRDFGENYAQELRDKAVELADIPDLRWHAIGPLQTNKAKYVAKHAHAFHALDNSNLAEELSRRRSGQALRCYIEVNLASEQSKAGLDPANVAAFLDSVRRLPGLQIVGLMSLPPLANDPERSRPYFKSLRELGVKLKLSELSMGTTADFEVAIEEGATAVRVGTAIFGERHAA